VGSALFGAAFFAIDTYVPLYVQGARGGGAGAAARVITPLIVTWALSAFVAARLIVRWGFRKTTLLGVSVITIGFVGLLLCAIYDAPQWMLTTILCITGFGFGPASMSYLLAAQEAVAWQQRGGVTSSVAFFRTMGAAVGIGLLGALFNILVTPGLSALASRGATPAALLNPAVRDQLPQDVLASAQSTIAHGLTWVFAVMVCFAAGQVVVALLMRRGKCDHVVHTSEALEAMA